MSWQGEGPVSWVGLVPQVGDQTRERAKHVYFGGGVSCWLALKAKSLLGGSPIEGSSPQANFWILLSRKAATNPGENSWLKTSKFTRNHPLRKKSRQSDLPLHVTRIARSPGRHDVGRGGGGEAGKALPRGRGAGRLPGRRLRPAARAGSGVGTQGLGDVEPPATKGHP